jgi:chromate transporter
MGAIFLAFLRLGLTSFGGPIAHLGYFRTEFVERRRWLDESAYAELVGLCQFLPGPASSQVGFSLGLLRGGWRGALAAWAGFTLPSALLLTAFAYGAGSLQETAWGTGLLRGLKLAAVAIVAQAVWGMARSLCPDRPRATIGMLATVLACFAPAVGGQLAVIVLGALAGLLVLRDVKGSEIPAPFAVTVPRWAGVVCLLTFAVLLVASLLWRHGLASGFYRSGALVFGGGHVILPLLHDAVVASGRVSESAFLAGYGATQAVPGPISTFAAYLGAVSGGLPGAAIGLVAIFLPGLLLAAGVLPFWQGLRRLPWSQPAMRGANAAVVGLLAAALYDPVWTGSVHVPADFAVAVTGFVLLVIWRVPPLAIVALCAMCGLVLPG